ncbi:MAG: hypothetical protein RJB38_2222 [Pseudomonadota bacterium]
MGEVSGLSDVMGSGKGASASQISTISVVWQRPGQADQVLKVFPSNELKALKGGTLRERAPGSAQSLEWKGPWIATVLEESMKGLSAEARSQIDLVVLRGADGEKAWIPRAFLVRYPMVLAEPRWSSAVPVQSRPKLRTEELPHDTYWVSGVQRVELTNYREQFGKYYLKRRTDPAAMRGEKTFVQNCLACHASNTGTDSWRDWDARTIAERLRKHPRRAGFQELASRSEKALLSYWSAYLAEQIENR